MTNHWFLGPGWRHEMPSAEMGFVLALARHQSALLGFELVLMRCRRGHEVSSPFILDAPQALGTRVHRRQFVKPTVSKRVHVWETGQESVCQTLHVYANAGPPESVCQTHHAQSHQPRSSSPTSRRFGKVTRHLDDQFSEDRDGRQVCDVLERCWCSLPYVAWTIVLVA